eukprot:311083-Pelagomonas_calceolata.AAC.1
MRHKLNLRTLLVGSFHYLFFESSDSTLFLLLLLQLSTASSAASPANKQGNQVRTLPGYVRSAVWMRD